MVMYGPYNKDGELWTCDNVDACNGFVLPDGSYGYATTTKFPYTVGCFGPGPKITNSVLPACSTNTCTVSNDCLIGYYMAAVIVTFALYL
jgi:hypothetical protein